MSNNTTATEAGLPEPEGLRVIRIILSVVIMFLGISGNGLVCVLVYQNRKMRTAMNYFLVNLAICDGIICLFNIPTTLVYNEYTKTWPFGLAFCKILPAMQQMVLAAAPLSLVAVSWERFKWIVLTFNEKMSLTQAKLIILIIWLLGILNSLPILGAMKMKDQNLFNCVEVFPKHLYRQMYTVLNFTLFYLIPVLFITPLYIQMVWKLRQRTETTGQLSDSDVKRRKAALKMLLIVVVTYAVCVLPNHIIFLLWDFHHVPLEPKSIMALNYMTLLLWANSMINPIIYCAQSSDYARGFINILCCGPVRKRMISHVRRARGQSFVSTAEHTKRYELVRAGQSSSNSS
ncbi:neuropeptide FF receptor 1-like [Dendronephthya gigantea]|uniref:neuropeptide FF receptor 1-like n=1 Tax=Dendronephthya gigantea TaxID=151771 RepID=UPI00106ACDE8|nr:neuropeptide FF receptor 1-like [Dendronephthya gigantea]XP_028411766.1 neuropeptide FF receptor 1-like [Dendronephthya gigantea]